MKKNVKKACRFGLFLLMLIQFLALPLAALRSPAYPGVIDFRQPDGTIVKVRMMGDEDLRWAETEDGYTLLFDEEGFLVFADKADDGTLITTKMRAVDAPMRSDAIKMHLANIGPKAMFSEKQVQAVQELKDARVSTMRKLGKINGKVTPVVGIRKNLVILVDFPDLPFTYTRENFNSLMNDEHSSESMPSNASVRDYFREASFGQLDLQTTVVGVYRMSKPMAYYGGNNGSTDTHAREMVMEAIEQADKDINLADFDNDGDGRVDGMHIIYAGYGEEAGGGADCIWAHASSVSSSYDGVSVGRYSCSPELRNNNGKNRTYIGVICHETAHVLGTMDFYDTDYGVNGSYPSTGEWDIMAQGSWNGGGACPAFFNPYSVIYDFGWAEAKNGNMPSSLSLTHHDKDSYVRIDTPTEGEYFLLEYRNKKSFDTEIPGHGLMVYRATDDLNRKNSNTINSRHPQQFYPLSANATVEIPNSSPSSYGTANSASCPFPGANNVTEITDYTVPSMKTWKGIETGYPITKIEEDLSMNSVSFDIAGGNHNGAYGLKTVEYGSDYISLEWQTSVEGATMMLVYNTSPKFGIPDSPMYKIGESIPGGGEVLYIGTGLEYKHTGLQDRTYYYYTVFTWDDIARKWNGGVIKSCRTATGVIRDFPYVENFESGEVDAAWQEELLVGDGIWIVRNKSGLKYLQFDSWEGTTDQMSIRMILPVMDFTGIETATLSFEYTNNLESTDVMYRTSCNGEWNILCSLDKMTSSYVLDSFFLIDLPNLSSEYQICFVPNYNNHNADSKASSHHFNIDDIKVTPYADFRVYTQTKKSVSFTSADIPVKTLGGSPNNIITKGILYSSDNGLHWQECFASEDNVCHIDNLMQGTTYLYKSYALLGNEHKYGATYQFQTLEFNKGLGTKDDPCRITCKEDWNKIEANAQTQYDFHDYRICGICKSKTALEYCEKCGSIGPFTTELSKYIIEDLYIRLEKDLELTHSDRWQHAIACVLNGNGHTITICPDRDYEMDNQPILSAVICEVARGGIISNLTVRNDPNCSNYYVSKAMVCCSSDGTIENCTVHLTGHAEAIDNFGAITGSAECIFNCHSVLDDLYSETFKICGIAINNDKVGGGLMQIMPTRRCVSNCTTNGKLTGNKVAGIIGEACYVGGTISKCINYATIESLSSASTCGAIAIVNSRTIESCTNYGTLKGRWVAGIAYENNSTVSNCHNAGNYVNIIDEEWPANDILTVAGIVNTGRGTITNCLFSGMVDGTYSKKGTALSISPENSDFKNCFFTGNFVEKSAEKATPYDLKDPYFVEVINGNALEGAWVLDGVAKLRFEVDTDTRIPESAFQCSIKRIRSTSADISFSMYGKRIVSCGIEWKEEREEKWNSLQTSAIDGEFTITDLQPLHIYEWRMFSIDDNDLRNTSSNKSFATLSTDVTDMNDTLFISNLYTFRAFAMTVTQNESYLDKTVKLTSDIDMLGDIGNLWQPIKGRFRGILDGNGHILKNMKIDTSSGTEPAGLFASTELCKIKNLGILNADINSYLVAGGFVGNGIACIEQCFFSGKINLIGSSLFYLQKHGGGIAAFARQVINCYSTSGIVSRLVTGNDNIYPEAKKENCYGNLQMDHIVEINPDDDYWKPFFDSGAWLMDSPSNPINNGYPILKWQQHEPRVSTQEVFWDEHEKAYLKGIYVNGFGKEYTHFGFEWFQAQEGTPIMNVLSVENTEDFTKVLEGVRTGAKCNYRAFACTESNDSIYGEWVAFERKNGNAIPYIEKLEQDETEGMATLHLGVNPGNTMLVRYELEYYDVNNPAEIHKQTIENISEEVRIHDLLTYTKYQVTFCAYDNLGNRFESRPLTWQTPIFGLHYTLRGDANGDGKVSMADVTTAIAKNRGFAVDYINMINADVHEDLRLNKQDIVDMKDIILQKPLARCASDNLPNVQLRVSSPVVDIADDSKVYLYLENASDITAFSMDVVLPSYTSVKDIVVDHDFAGIYHNAYFLQHNDTTRIVVFSWDNELLHNIDKAGDKCTHLQLILDSKNLPDHATLDMSVVNCSVVDGNFHEYGVSDYTNSLSISDPLLINGIYYQVLQDTDKSKKMAVAAKRTGYYSGDILIPEKVTYKGNEFTVTEISQINKPFEGNTQIESVVIPGCIDFIPNSAFYGCKNLKKVHLAEGIKEIRSSAFANTMVDTIRIPSTVEYIGGMIREKDLKNDAALGIMNNLESFEVSPDNPYFMMSDDCLYTKSGKQLIMCFIGEQDLFVIPTDVDTLAYHAFDNAKVKNVYMPQNLKVIGSLHFDSVENIVLYSEQVPTLYNTNGFPNATTLYVPKEQVEIYKSANNWRRFKDVRPIGIGKITLEDGWTWKSFNIKSPETSDINYLANAMPEITSVYSQIGFTIKDPILGWVGNSNFDTGVLYKIRADKNQNIDISGIPSVCKDSQLKIYPGWTWFGYLPTFAQSVAASMSNFSPEEGDIVLGQDQLATYVEGAWQGNFTMKPGSGYMYYSSADDVKQLIYAESTEGGNSGNNSSVEPSERETYWTYNPHAFANTTALFAKIVGLSNPNYEVAAFVNDECRGVSRLANSISMLAVHGDNGETVEFFILDKMDGTIYRANETVTNNCGIIGTFQNPLILTLGDIVGNANVTMVENIETNDVHYDIYDLKGHRVLETQKRPNHLPHGVYMINGKKVIK